MHPWPLTIGLVLLLLPLPLLPLQASKQPASHTEIPERALS